MATSRNVLEIIISASDQASNVIDQVVGGASKKLQGIGTGMMKGGAILGMTLTLLTAVLGDATNQAMVFDETMTNIQAVLGATDDQVATLSDQILDLGENSRAGPQEAAAAFYDIVGGVADASTHMAILEASIATAEAGAADLGGTTSALISIMNSYGFAADQAGFASDVLTQTVGAGVGTMDEFASAFPQVSGLASSLSIDFDDLGAAMAFLTTKGFSASQSATQLRAMMVAMLNPNEKMKTALEEAGLASGEAAIQQLGLVGAYEALMDKSPKFVDNVAGAVGSVEALNGIISLTDDAFAGFEDTFVDSVAGATSAAQAIQLDSPAAQADLMRSSMEALRVEVGLALVPAMQELFSSVRPIIQGFAAWARENPDVIQQVAKLVGVGWALSSVLTTSGGVISSLGSMVKLLPMLTGPVGLLIAAGAALFIAWKKNFLGIRDVVDDAVAFVTDIIQNDLWNELTAIWDALQAGDLEGVVAGIGDLFTSIYNVILFYLPSVRDALGNMAQAFVAWVVDVAPDVWAALVSFGERVLAWVVETAPKVAAQLLAWGQQLVEWVAPMIPPLLAALGGLAASALSWIAGQVPGVIAQLRTWGEQFVAWVGPQIPPLLKELGDLAGDVLGWIEDRAPDVLGQLGDWVEAFADWVVPAAEELLLALPGLLADLLEWVLEVLPDITVQLIEWGKAFFEWVGPAALSMLDALGGLLADLVYWLTSKMLPAILREMPGVADALISFVGEAINKVGPALWSFLSTVTNWIWSSLFPSIWSNVKAIGKSFVDGLKQGITDNWDSFKNWLQDQFDIDLIGGVKDWLGVGSPSKVFMGIGGDLVSGLAIGMGQFDSVARAAENLAGATLPPAMAPATASPAGGGGTFHINVQVTPDTIDRYANGREFGQDAARSIRDELQSWQRWHGGGVVG